MKKKPKYFIGIVLIIIIVLFTIRFVLDKDGEDCWIRDSKGVWIKHGHPENTPDYVNEQQLVIQCAKELYSKAKEQGIELNSECLGTCGNYAVDIVNVPRNNEDNRAENQCEDYKTGNASNFIELNKNGEIVRIFEK